jgi:hypothetical protein
MLVRRGRGSRQDGVVGLICLGGRLLGRHSDDSHVCRLHLGGLHLHDSLIVLRLLGALGGALSSGTLSRLIVAEVEQVGSLARRLWP